MAWITIHTRSGKLVHVQVPDRDVDRTIRTRATRAAKADAKAVTGGKQRRAAALKRASHLSTSNTAFAQHYQHLVERTADTDTRRGRGLVRAAQGHTPAERAMIQGRMNELAQKAITNRDKATRDEAKKAAARLAARPTQAGQWARQELSNQVSDWRESKRSGAGKQAKVPIVVRGLAKIRAMLTRG